MEYKDPVEYKFITDESDSSMMRDVQGFIDANALGRFESTFMIDGLKYNFSGSFASSVPPFECHNATLRFSNITQLTSTRSFSGTIGPKDINLKINNEVSIFGTLNMPLDPGSSVSGSGVWTQN